jgi:hypothetical protein
MTKETLRRISTQGLLASVALYLLSVCGFSFENARLNAVIALSAEIILCVSALLSIFWLGPAIKIWGILASLALPVVIFFVYPFNQIDVCFSALEDKDYSRRLESTEGKGYYRLCHYLCFEPGRKNSVNRMIAEYPIFAGIKFSRKVGSAWE